MKRIGMVIVPAFTVLVSFAAMGEEQTNTPRILDDFSSQTTTSTLGTAWEFFTDDVMGGKSTGAIAFEETESEQYLRMTGILSLENNGGFVQARLPLTGRGTFDASEYEGIRLRVRGKPGSYYVFANSAKTRFPWQYFEHPLPVTEEWQTVEIPFAGFEAKNFMLGGGKLDSHKLKSIGIVAAFEEFEVDIMVSHAELYR